MPFQNSSTRIRQHRLILTGIMVLLVTLVIAVLVVVLKPRSKGATGSEVIQWKGKGTTEHLHEIILGRCYNYIATVNPELRDKDCLQIWELFQKAFMYKDPCSATEEDYQPLMDLARHSIPCNKSLFWSTTNDLVHRYTKADRGFLTLEDTMLGYIADGVTWCGDLSSPGVSFKSCPKWTECESNPSSIYWKMASKMFAEAACGTVQVLLNGSTEAGAFRDNSIFGSVEIVNLNPNKVSKMQIWLMHDIDGPQSETCMGHSIRKLKEILENRTISVSCEDNYRPVQLLQCTSNPDHTTCRVCS
ncbi:ADP-ribosyl cyclase/cyclic ADP-ribose hydrolase 1 [Rhineura floridana]|uniref:ADP-ribosyl cyclase/cyclic ADP-ribose hydrolase 1 n=1 Tax=Rhineura floridana TaxID=261503 RepID=UPI002AC88750|nr:ADP-ribosyl cyclase/cyclic ADP-ribose hydrolase 1 [Rhineura floridana]